MDYVPFYKTRMGEKFVCKTVPDLIRAVERLADNVASERRDPTVAELIEYAGYLAESAERLFDTPIEPGNAQTRDAFDLLRANVSAVRRVLGKLDATTIAEPPTR